LSINRAGIESSNQNASLLLRIVRITAPLAYPKNAVNR
jgi:hypothetical protein